MLSNEERLSLFLVGIFCICLMCIYSYTSGTSSARKETEEKTIVYCMEQPSACKTKYDYYKLENKK